MKSERSDETGFDTNRALNEGNKDSSRGMVEMKSFKHNPKVKAKLIKRKDLTSEIENDIQIFKPPKPEYMVYGEYLFMIA